MKRKNKTRNKIACRLYRLVILLHFSTCLCCNPIISLNKKPIFSAITNQSTIIKLIIHPKTKHPRTVALEIFEKNMLRELEVLSLGLAKGGFQPAIVNIVEVAANIGFNYGANIYSQKHEMIITCPSNSQIHFYDANEMTPIKSRTKKRIYSSVVQMSYSAETDTYLIGSASGEVYAYNASTDSLSKVLKEGTSFILGITYINSNTFAFSSAKSNNLYFGNLESRNAIPHYSKNSHAWYLHHVKEQKVLLSGLANGKVALYNTNASKGARPFMIDSVQAHRFGRCVTTIIDAKINGKKYIITGGNDHTIKIWHFLKGKMRLLKVIQNTEQISTLVYLEDYKMVASSHHKEFIKFFKVPSGKLETTLDVGLTKARNMFLMKDKNCLGVADLNTNLIKVVQLHPSVPKGL